MQDEVCCCSLTLYLLLQGTPSQPRILLHTNHRKQHIQYPWHTYANVHDRWYGTQTTIKNGGVRLGLWIQNFLIICVFRYMILFSHVGFKYTACVIFGNC